MKDPSSGLLKRIRSYFRSGTLFKRVVPGKLKMENFVLIRGRLREIYMFLVGECKRVLRPFFVRVLSPLTVINYVDGPGQWGQCITVRQRTVRYLLERYSALFLHTFSVFHCGNLHFSRSTFLCCILFILLVFSCCTLFMLYFFHFAIFSCSIFFMLHHFSVSFFCVLIFSCCTFLM